MKKLLLKTLGIVALSFLIILSIRYYVVQPFSFNGDLMKPTIHDGEYLLINQLIYHFIEPKRGDIIAFCDPDCSRVFIGRILALPGEVAFADLHEGKYGHLEANRIPVTRELTQNEIEYLFTTVHWIDFPRFSPTIADTDLYQRIKMSDNSLDLYKIIVDNYTNYDPDKNVADLVPRNMIFGRVMFKN